MSMSTESFRSKSGINSNKLLAQSWLLSSYYISYSQYNYAMLTITLYAYF